jgi:uncharacterized membrane protein
MKKLFFLMVLSACFIFPQVASADQGWDIHTFHSDIIIQPSGTVHVLEKISVDFKNMEKHGIYRDIPYIYHGNNNILSYLNISVNSVTRNRQPSNYTVSLTGDIVKIKIGDANKMLSGKQEYVIDYTVIGALKAFSDHDELYWNATGNYWATTITAASTTVHLPQPNITQTTCFEGTVGEKESCALSQPNKIQAEFTAKRALLPTEGLTVVVGWTKGMVPIIAAVKPKTFTDKLFSIEPLVIFHLTFLFSTGNIFWLWWTRGRDKWVKNPLLLDETQIGTDKPLLVKEATVVEFTPPENLRPAEIGVLIDERADTIDVTSTIIDLASRDFLTITEIPKKWLFGKVDYTLTKKEQSPESLLAYEKSLLTRLFSGGKKSVTVSTLKQTFYDDLTTVKELLYKDMEEKGLFVSNPEKVRTQYTLYAVALLVVSSVLFFFSISNEWVLPTAIAAGLFPGGLVLLLTARGMPRRTEKGYDLYRRIKGYRLFINTSEKYRQRFFEKENMFNEILPYAIVFGLTEKFSQAMKTMGIKPPTPTWYAGYSTFNPVLFSSQVNSFSESFSSAIAATPKSSGFSSGGSSGGGFGGGGGGSW